MVARWREGGRAGRRESSSRTSFLGGRITRGAQERVGGVGQTGRQKAWTRGAGVGGGCRLPCWLLPCAEGEIVSLGCEPGPGRQSGLRFWAAPRTALMLVSARLPGLVVAALARRSWGRAGVEGNAVTAASLGMASLRNQGDSGGGFQLCWRPAHASPPAGPVVLGSSLGLLAPSWPAGSSRWHTCPPPSLSPCGRRGLVRITGI